MIRQSTATTSTGPPQADIDRSPTLLLASLFAAHRSGDELLKRFYLQRLRTLGISISFGNPPTATIIRRKGGQS